MIIGIDLDNTIVRYDVLMREVALSLGLVSEETPAEKLTIRDKIRASKAGDIGWQKVQGLVYGPNMNRASLIEGVKDFFYLSRKRKAKLFIVSHKTQYAGYDPTHTDLRKSALNWLEINGFFSELGLSKERIFFESTRAEKVTRIKELGCTLFIDDLIEVFLEPHFPESTQKLLFHESQNPCNAADITVCDSWNQISKRVFN
jgi:hypothetical protein